MEEYKIKKGTIQKIDDDRITLLNSDGPCEDNFVIYSQFANEIRDNIEVGNIVIYVTEGDQLLALGLEETAPLDLKMLYEVMPRTIQCSNEPPSASA